jgi:hypothetical protein
MASLARFLEGGAFGVINDILSTFHSEDGYAVPNRFECLILPPPTISVTRTPGSGYHRASYSDPYLTSNDARAVSMRCESTTMPGRNLSAIDDTNIYGPSREIVSGVTYAGDVEMLFQASSGLEERVFFEEWQKKAFDEETWNVKYHDEYTSEIQIYLLDKKDQRRYGIRLHEAYPKTIGAVGLNQAPSSEIIKIPVTFSFRWWETLDINRTPPSLGEKIFSTVINTVERNITRNIPRVLTKL